MIEHKSETNNNANDFSMSGLIDESLLESWTMFCYRSFIIVNIWIWQKFLSDNYMTDRKQLIYANEFCCRRE